MTVQTDFLERCKALNLHDGKLSDWLDEIESLRQQLSAAIAALAACKAKDEAMREFIAALDGWTLDDLSELKREAVEKALTIQPDDSALKAWLGEPAGYKRLWALNGEVPAKERRENGRLAWPYKFKLLPVTEGKCLPDDVPLYSPKGLK